MKQSGLQHSIGNLNSYIEELMKRNSEIASQEQEATILSLENTDRSPLLYNALNKLHLSALEANQGDLASRYSGLLRFSAIRLTVKCMLSSFYQDLQQLKQFVMAMQENKPQSFSLYYDIDSQLYDSIVPKMFLQPLWRIRLYMVSVIRVWQIDSDPRRHRRRGCRLLYRGQRMRHGCTDAQQYYG